jgi:hypothetical protein
MFSRQFYLIALGLVFIALDVRLGGVDVLLPDFIGYLLICIATSALQPYAQVFGGTAVCAGFALLVSLPDFINFDPLHVVGGARLILDVVTIWMICTGVVHLATAAGNIALARMADTLRVLNLAMAAVNVTFLVLAWLVPVFKPFSIVLVVLSIVAGVAVILLMLRAARELPPAAAAGAPAVT